MSELYGIDREKCISPLNSIEFIYDNDVYYGVIAEGFDNYLESKTLQFSAGKNDSCEHNCYCGFFVPSLYEGFQEILPYAYPLPPRNQF